MKLSVLIATVLLVGCNSTFAKSIPERVYQEKTCTSLSFPQSKSIAVEASRMKYTRVRVDCLTDTYAIEYDFAYKRYEALGQALTYSAMTGKKAGIVLIMKKQKDYKYLNNLLFTIKKLELPVTVWTVSNNFKLKKVNYE